MGRPFVQPPEAAREPAAVTRLGQQLPARAFILAAQHVLARQQRFVAPVRFVGADQPASRLGLAHTHHRHAGEARIVVRFDQAHVAPGVPVIVRPPVADGGVLLQPAFPAVALPDRLGPEGVDAAAAARDERHEPVLVVVDGEGDARAVPALPAVRRAERHQVVDLALGAAVVAAALRGVVIGAVGREHQQVVAAGRDRGAGLEQRPRRTVDHLSLHSGHRQQADLFQRHQTAGRGADAGGRPMNRDPVCQRQRLVRHRE